MIKKSSEKQENHKLLSDFLPIGKPSQSPGWVCEEQKQSVREFSAEKQSTDTGVSLHFRSSSSKDGQKMAQQHSIFSQNNKSNPGTKDSMSNF